jgi:DNA mismatch repair protein MutS2
VAARLGLRSSIIDAARQFRSVREAQLAEHLAKVDHQLHALEHERRLLERERELIAETEVRFRSREEALRQREEASKRRIEGQLEDRLRDARRAIDTVVDDLKREAARLATEAARRQAPAQVLSTGETGNLRADARAALESVASRLRGSPASEAAPAERVVAPAGGRPAPGDRVSVGPLGLEGVIQSVHGEEAEVSVHGKRLRASLSELRLLGAARPSRGSVTVQVPTREGAPTDLNVIGCTVDEALSRTDKFLDEALLAEVRVVRVIHGHGTGQLRRAIGSFLQGHPLVARVAPAPPDQGGSGVTVAELKD